jgi:asparagine synthetase B (glutamine-hydrolysing)
MEFTAERWTHGMHKIADEMHQALAMSLARRVGEDAEVLLPLSGGFDSRTMLGLLQERPARARALTQCQPGAFGIDTRFARQLARRAGVPHKVVPLRDDFLARYRRKCVGINGGLYDIHTGRYLSMVEQQEGGGLPTVSGHLGGELTGRFQVADTRFSTPEERYELAWREVNMFRFTPEQAAGLLANGRGPQLANSVVERSRRFFFAGDGEPYQQFLRWDVLLYRRRFISFQLLYLEQFCRTVAPFTDRDLVDFVCSLPFAALEDQRAYREMICRHFRDLARVPNTNDLPLVTTTKGVLKDFLYSQYKRFFRKPLQGLLHLRRWTDHPNVQLGYALAGESSAVLDHIEASRDRMAPYVDADAVTAMVGRHRAGDYDSTNGLLALSTFATALEMLEEPRSALNVWEGPHDA